MAVISSISCSLKPPAPAPFREASSAAGRPQPMMPATATGGHCSWSSSLRRACVAAAACAVVGMAGAGGGPGVALARDAVASTSNVGGAGVVGRIIVDARAGAPPRWSDRMRQCPAWRANSLENVVPENLPRPSAQRRFNDVAAAAGRTGGGAPSPSPDAVAPFFLARRSGSGMGCFSL